MINLKFFPYNLIFKRPSTTSRGTLTEKPGWIFELTDTDMDSLKFHGECPVIPGLSPDNILMVEDKLQNFCNKVNNLQTIELDEDLNLFPALQFGLETLKMAYNSKNEKVFFENEFTSGNRGIPINGLIWMGDKRNMFDQIKEKLNTGWRCIKIKIGGIDFNDEIKLLKYIRNEFSENELELRLDANGAFQYDEAIEKLTRLSQFYIHSIEQPIKQGNIEKMAEICDNSPIPIALDEELIAVNEIELKKKLLQTIKPDYIILKPSLLGGFEKSDEWINFTEVEDIEYWVTSALESNIGLNAISQWTSTKSDLNKVHGLGTGMLYVNNFESPLKIDRDELFFDPKENFKIKLY